MRVGELSRLLFLALAPPLLRFGAAPLLARAAAGEVGAVGRIEPACDVRTGVERLRFRKALALMGEPGVAARVGVPVARRAFDPLQSRQQAKILFQPAIEQAPLPQQRLVRRLDRRFAGFFAGLAGRASQRVSTESSRSSTRRSISGAASGGMSERRAMLRRGRLAVGVDAGEPGDQPASQQSEPRLAVAGNARIGVRARERPLDGRIDRAS